LRRKEFFENLSLIYLKSPDAKAISEYEEKLSKWKVTSEQLGKLYEILTEQCQFYPTISEFCQYAGEIGVIVKRKQEDRPFILFTRNGKRYAQPLRSIENLPKLPENATMSKLAIPSTMSYESQCTLTRDEQQQLFLQGWQESGANPADALKFLSTIRDNKQSNDEIPF